MGVFFADRFQRKRLLEKAHARAKDKELEQAREIEKAYTDLKATQTQLIHAEKMASLGELTAGIAHEIQNPLNFVNNFSEVNRELITELKSEIKKGNQEEVNSIADDIEANEEKINHHGRRADAIVKSMLQHSRINSSQKELTDINTLCDEYLRLAYHGMRAKDKSFNADFKADLDESLPKINVVPQDIGRVLLNLIKNAFYACTERSRSACTERSRSALSSEASAQESALSSEASAQGGDDYKPLVSVSTKLISPERGGAESPEKTYLQISISDNGIGIPDEIQDKIFQPFFTTKPTGQGTGLGLSLSYDIIKAHGGELNVETVEGAGAEFIITLPI
jgi:signal transduction histidine kinase